MVQGWQRRAEIAVARRVESKQRKQKKSHRANVKGMVSNLLTQLDKFDCRRVAILSERTVLHVWTEQQQVVETSHEHEERGSEEKQKQEPGAPVGSNSKRRARGVSSDNNDNHSSTSNGNKILCRTHFYKGYCASASATSNSKQGSAKRMSGCRHLHPAKHFQTLGDIAGQTQSAVLASAESAFLEATQDGTEEDLGGMEMLNYFPIQLPINTEGEHDADGDQQTVGQVFTKALRDHSCINASLVYVAFGNVLIFDRYQEGLLVADLGTVFGEGKRISSNTESTQEDTLAGAEGLPAAVLEYILTFLPDSSVASMTRVCTAWNSEIGKSSSYLWRQMLERRKWPLPPENSSLSPSARTHEAKCCFQMHYQVVRDVNAVKEALSALVNSKRAAPANDVEMVYQAFSTRRTAPSEPNACVAMEAWSPDEVLAAYSHDCTIRLFKAVAKGPTGGKTCRELISVCLNPFRKTSKVKTRLVAMGLDTDMVGCLLHAQGGIHKSTHILSIIQRDAYLEAAGGDTSSLGWSEPEEGVLNVIDINEVIVDYFLEHADDLATHLPYVYIDPNDLDDVQVVVSDTLVACGHGQFAIEAAIYISDPDLEDYDEAPRIMLGRKLVIISSLRGTVAWMGSLPWRTFPDNCNVFLTACVLGENPGRTASCRILAATPWELGMQHADITNTIEVCHGIHFTIAGDTAANEIVSLEDRGWRTNRDRRRNVVPFPNGSIVAIDILCKDRGNGFLDYRSCISVFSMEVADEGTVQEPLWLNHCDVLSMHRIRDEHVLLICEEVDVNEDDSDADPFDEVGGHWFSADPQRYIRGIVVHVPTRQVIDRAHIPFDISETGTTLSMCCGFNNTIGVGLSWKGVVLTGANVRAVGSCNTEQSKERPGNEADKKKKLARQIYSRKKEGRRAPRCSS